MPHGGCYLWTQSLIALHAISDGLIVLAYYSIPFTLLYFVRRRKDLKFKWIFLSFAMFVLACGTTHLLEIWNIWHANYWLSGSIKAVTALVSITTAVLLVKLLPRALALPSADALQKARDELEIRVQERTAELRKSEERLQLATSAGNIAVWDWDVARDELTWESSSDSVYGIRKEDFKGGYEEWRSMLHPDDRQFAEGEIQAALRGERNYAPEFRIIRPDGAVRIIKAESKTIRDQNGKAMRMVGINIDITERKQAEEELKAILRTSMDGFYLVDMEGRILETNDSYCSMIGYSREELLKMGVKDIEAIETDEEIKKRIELIAEREHARFETKHRRKDGRIIVIEASCNILQSEEKRIFCFMRDVTERKATEARIVRLGQLYEALSKCNQAIVHSSSLEDLLPKICRDVVEFGGLKMAWFGVVDETTGMVRPVTSFGSGIEYLEGIEISVDGENPSGCGPVGTAIRENRPALFHDFQNDPRTAPWHERAKRYVWTAVASLPVCRSGKPIGALSIYSDLDQAFDEEVRNLLVGMVDDINFALDSFARAAERKQTEEALLKAKTEAEVANQAKDRFIAMLSHELRTPLTPILLASTAMEADGEVPESIRADFEVIRRNVELEMKLVDDLLDVTRINRGIIQLHQEVVDAHACLRNALEIVRSEITAKHLNVSLRLEADQPQVWADSARLQQVLWNLLRNAVKFTPEGGEITVRSANVNGRLRMEVSDTGVGINPDVLSKIFNAFGQGEQSKTRRFGGLGLGLSISKALMELHQGTLTAFSEGTDKGAAFTIEIAAIPDMKEPPAPAGATPLPKKGSPKKILLVEDHADTLRFLARMLRKWGYTVTTADCVRSALEAAAKEPIDLLVSDLGLPDGSGLEIMKQVNHLYGVSGIAISGFGTKEDILQSHAAGYGEHLVKPLSIHDLHAAIQRITPEKT